MSSHAPPRPTRIVLAARYGLFRAGVRTLLNRERDFEVVAETSDPEELPEIIDRAGADVVLLESNLQTGNGGEVLVHLRTRRPACALVIVTSGDELEALNGSLSSEAHGLVAKKGPIRSLMEAIRAVRSGIPWRDPRLGLRRATRAGPRAARAAVARRADASPRRSWAPLTDRERQVAALVARGYRYRDVARHLRISEHTLKNHLRHIFDKLGVRSRLQLALTRPETSRKPETPGSNNAQMGSAAAP